MVSAFPRGVKRLRVERDAPFGRQGLFVEYYRDFQALSGLLADQYKPSRTRSVGSKVPILCRACQVLCFCLQGLSYMTNKAWMCRTIKLEVVAGLGEAQLSIYGAAHNVRIAIVLTIVLPPANGAESE
jgi:hypothetical protein